MKLFKGVLDKSHEHNTWSTLDIFIVLFYQFQKIRRPHQVPTLLTFWNQDGYPKFFCLLKSWGIIKETQQIRSHQLRK